MTILQRSEPACTTLPGMQGGGGEDSYANSSSPQNFIFRTCTSLHLPEALNHLCMSPHILKSLQIVEKDGDATVAATIACAGVDGARSSTSAPPYLAIADLGCSHGRNTLDFAAVILQGLQKRLFMKGRSPIEMQYLFSDLPANDFNSLFQSLPGFLQDMGADPSRKIFTSAVAGSFHGPLFPTCSLHFAISATSLHWLSQVPPAVLDRNSPAWNGGSIWLNGQRPKVMEAFAAQHQKDLRNFFQNRARELVRGGILFLLLPSRAELHPLGPLSDPRMDLWTGFFESTWTEMVCEGLITEDERNTFNIPFYWCHEMEFRKTLEEFTDVLEIVKMEVMRDCPFMTKEDQDKLLENPQAFGKFWAAIIASLMRPMVEAHIGEARAVKFFERLQMNITKKANQGTYKLATHLIAIVRRK